MTDPAHPPHITVDVVTTWTCERCWSRWHVGHYDDPDRADVLAAQWLARHAHDEPEEPT